MGELASSELKAHRDLVLAAVGQNGRALKHAAESLQNDPRVVQRAIDQNGCALEFASLALRDDVELVCSAILWKTAALSFASEGCKRQLMEEASEWSGTSLQDIERYEPYQPRQPNMPIRTSRWDPVRCQSILQQFAQQKLNCVAV